MKRVDNSRTYLDLANDLYSGRITERLLSDSSIRLPLLDRKLLEKLSQHSEQLALSEPRHSWAIARVAFSAANSQNSDIFIQALAAWYLGRAANDWGQPKRVAFSIAYARRRFEKLNEPGWIAACSWQQNMLSWTRPDLISAAHTLEQAAIALESVKFDNFVPHCRLALAYIQIMTRQFDDAKSNIFTCEEAFSAKRDTLNLARCRWHRASLLRRELQFDRAIEELDDLLQVFKRENSPVDIAKTHSQIALIGLLRTDNLSQTISHFEQAAQIFHETDLDLWEAASLNYLGSCYTQDGQFKKATECFLQSRKRFLYHGVPGLLADNLTDNGKLNTLLGRSDLSIQQYKQAEDIYDRTGLKLQSAISISNRGEAYGQIGRYQDALQCLENAAECLNSLGDPLRSGTCEKYTSLIWIQLGQPMLAHEHLDKALRYYEEAGQKALLSSIHNSRAQIYFEQGNANIAIECLKQSLSIAEAHGVRPQAMLARRLLGEALLRIGKYDEAQKQLERALSDSSEMGMLMEHAACLVATGIYYLQLSDLKSATKGFEDALEISKNLFPDIEWSAYVGLARLAEIQGSIQAEIQAYSDGINALAKVRYSLWQPALVGSYLQVPSAIFNKAIVLAARIGAYHDSLRFIEENKATTLLVKLLMPNTNAKKKITQELNDIKAEINWLQNQLRVSFDDANRLKSAIQSRQLRNQLADKIKQYDMVSAQIERRNSPNEALVPHIPKLDVALFRELANDIAGPSWIALDYYITEDQLITIVITSEGCRVYQTYLSKRLAMVLEISQRASRDATVPSQEDLIFLGDSLIPAEVARALTPNTYLFLLPHKKLHGIPWAAVHTSITSQPLVQTCIPVIAPSLRCLSLLLKRTKSRISPKRENGLLVGISHFSNTSRRELPNTRKELVNLSSRLGQFGQCLSEDNATWENILKLTQRRYWNKPSDGLSRFNWLHLASHTFADIRTGRLSGIALWDRDIWQDQLLDLAPLPRLVTISGCNSIYNYIHEGDEHIGLPSTCFMGGTDSVVGSIWPIMDAAAAEFMISFYDYYFKGLGPSQAVAETQREMIKREEKADCWAGFICTGSL